jgi:hypothetical protein
MEVSSVFCSALTLSLPASARHQKNKNGCRAMWYQRDGMIELPIHRKVKVTV